MTQGMQKTMVLCGVAFIFLVFPSFVMTGLLPPISPLHNADEVAHFWASNTGLKRMGLVLMLATAGLQAPFIALIAVRIRQMERSRYSPLAYTQLIAGGSAVMAIILPAFVFAAASFRPERDPQITQALNDLGWLLFVMNWPAHAVLCLVIGFAIFGAKIEIWPRWLGYCNILCAFVIAAGGLVVLFKDGVFAWNGLLAFWLAATFFGVWFLVMAWQLWTTIQASESDAAATAVVVNEPA